MKDVNCAPTLHIRNGDELNYVIGYFQRLPYLKFKLSALIEGSHKTAIPDYVTGVNFNRDVAIITEYVKEKLDNIQIKRLEGAIRQHRSRQNGDGKTTISVSLLAASLLREGAKNANMTMADYLLDVLYNADIQANKPTVQSACRNNEKNS